MVLEFKDLNEVEKLIRIAYYMHYPDSANFTDHATIYELQDWSDAVGIHMYYCGGSVYFDNKKDQTMFILRWS